MPKKKVDSPPMDVPQPIVDGLLLYQVQAALFKLTERALLASGLSAPQMMFLGMLYWDGRALVPRRMRNTLVLEAQSLTGIIDGLEEKGLAERLKHPEDRRKIRVQIPLRAARVRGGLGEHGQDTGGLLQGADGCREETVTDGADETARWGVPSPASAARRSVPFRRLSRPALGEGQQRGRARGIEQQGPSLR